MRIGIDASRMNLDQPTGTERYSYEVITRILMCPEAWKHEWIVYLRSDFKFQMTNVKCCVINMPYLWTQVGLAVRTWSDRLDVLWVPAHTLPVMRKLNLKTVVTIHGIEYEWLPAYENWLQRWYLPLSTKYAVRFADRIIAVSEFTKRQLVERLGADEKKIEVIHEGVAENNNFQAQNSVSVLEKYNIQKKKYFLFIGTIQPRKNLKKLVAAFNQLNNKYLKLVICGKWGWDYEILQQLKASNVIFTGYVDDTIRQVLLNNAIVYVQPSITEGFGLPILEAWQAGLPVISSRGGALTEVVGDGGLLFNPESITEISKSMEAAIKNRSELIRKGRERLKMFSWDNTTSKTYSILTNLY